AGSPFAGHRARRKRVARNRGQGAGRRHARERGGGRGQRGGELGSAGRSRRGRRASPRRPPAGRDGPRPLGGPGGILVAPSGALFVRGGPLVIAEETCAALRRAGHLAEILITPQNRFGRQLSAYAATWLTDVGETADGHPVDQVISFRFPSYAVRHPRHVCWLN